jgi:hypothetical protein
VGVEIVHYQMNGPDRPMSLGDPPQGLGELRRFAIASGVSVMAAVLRFHNTEHV